MALTLPAPPVPVAATATQLQQPLGGTTIGMSRSIRYPGAFSAMSISAYGRDVVLAGRAGLAVVDLDHPLAPLRTIPIESTWNISRVAWCPRVEHHGWVATAVNQTLLVHDLGSAGRVPMRALRAHPMGITDIAWAPMVPSWVGTASIDPIIKIWDVRRDQKPVWYFSKWEPADMLAFNPVHMHKLASVHRNRIAVWDIRFGSAPLMTLDDAHADGISSISWHPTQDDVLVSASLDHTVKRWRVEPNQPTEEYAHLFASEVAGAEYLPFGEALLVTQRSADHSAVVIRDDAELTVVHEFVGLASPLLGSAWRSRWDASRARHQLVTWEKDQVLRMWAVGDSTVAAAGGGARQRSEMPAAAAAAPSFATNFLQPEQLLHLLDQKAMDSGLLLAATAAADGGATTWHELARTGRLARASAAPAWRTGLAPARASTSDEHTSDDDNTPTTTPTSKIKDIAAPTAWREEVESVVLGRYRQSGTVTLCDPNTVGRLRRLQVGVPWITDEAVELDVLFPQRYPRAPLRIAVDAVPAVFGAASALADLAAATADACAELGVPALDRCLHAVLAALVEAARSQKAHAEGDRAEDAERIPPPLPPLQATPARQRTGHVTVAARLFGRPPAAADDDGDTASSDESSAGRSRARTRHGRDTGSLYSDEVDGDGYDNDDDDEFYALGYDDGARLYGSDSSHAEAAGTDDVLRRVTRDRNLSRVPFPRLCGAVFAGPGQLVCFFASIYSADKYPGMSSGGQLQDAGRDRGREDMLRQLHQQVKPRMYRKLDDYRGSVQFVAHTSGAAGPLAHSGSLGDSDEERHERQDEEMPRYFFRQEPARLVAPTAAAVAATAAGDQLEGAAYFRPSYFARMDSGIGNMALLCAGIDCETANRPLARQFVMSGCSAEWICRQNAKVAAFNGRQHLAHLWALLATVLGPASAAAAASEHAMWLAHTPVNRWLQTEMARYERRGDIQTLALIACVITIAVAEAAVRRGRATDGDAGSLPPWVMAAAAAAAAVAPGAAELGPSSTALELDPLTAAAAAHHAPNRNVTFRLPSSSGASMLLSGPSQQPPPSLSLAPADADSHGAQPPLAGSQSSAAAAAATHVPPLVDTEPDSPELIRELDRDEIKQNELMMAEGMGETTRRPPASPGTARPLSDAASAAASAARAKADLQRQSPSDKPDDRSPAGADSSENLWRRLRTNVFSRVNTTGAPSAKSPDDNSVGRTGPSSEPGAAAAGLVRRSSASSGGSNDGDGKGGDGPRVRLAEAQMWAALQQQPAAARRGRRGAERLTAEDGSHVQAYMQMKREYARAHTRMVMHEVRPTMEMWAQDPRHDCWKLLYARILFRWEMDIKAVEVLKCVQDPRFHAIYKDMYSQPSVPRHDNLPRTGNPVLAIKQSARRLPPNAKPDADGRPRRQRDDHLQPPPLPARAVRPASDDGDAAEDVEAGAPWLSCAWCHEYVHGRALICHACGHGGHQEHMLRWFRIVRKHLMRIGLTPAQYVLGSAATSVSGAASPHRGAPGHRDADPAVLASAVPSVITAGDLARSFANSPVLGAEGLLASSAERLPLLTDTLLPQPLPEDADSTQHGLHIRMLGPSSLSRQLSRDAHLLDTADSSDNDYDTSAPTPAMGPPPLPGAADHPFMQDSNAWESSDADSGDQIRPSHGVVLRRELGAIADFDQELLDADLDEAARLLQQGIPTCPSGCGCNCLSESYRLIA